MKIDGRGEGSEGEGGTEKKGEIDLHLWLLKSCLKKEKKKNASVKSCGVASSAVPREREREKKRKVSASCC